VRDQFGELAALDQHLMDCGCGAFAYTDDGDHYCKYCKSVNQAGRRGRFGLVESLLRLVDERGTGADRQRAIWAESSSPAQFTDALARATRATD
jgi:hypothetical protein